MKKNILLGLAITFSSLMSFSQVRVDTVVVNNNHVEKIFVEINEPSEAAILAGVAGDALSYRIFVDLEDGWSLIGFSGYDIYKIPFMVSSTQPFYNPANTGSTGADVSLGFWSIFPNLEYDSYATDGRVGSDSVGILKSLDADGNGYMAITTATTPIIDVVLGLQHPIFTDNTTTYFNEINGGWGMGQVIGPTPENIIFVGQFTTSGDLKMKFNVTCRDVHANQRVARNIVYGFDKSPEIIFTNPIKNTYITLKPTIELSTTVKDYDGKVDSVQFYVNNIKIGTDTGDVYSDSYSRPWSDVSIGNHSAKAIAFDNDGNISADSVSFTVGEPKSPEITISEPSDNDIISIDSAITIIIAANDIDGDIVDLKLFINDVFITSGNNGLDKISKTWIPDAVGSYIIKAIATDNDSSATTETVTVQVKAQNVSISDKKILDVAIEVYPNPVYNLLNIEFPESISNQTFEISLYDIIGNKVLGKTSIIPTGNYTNQIDLSALNKGLYIIEIKSEDGKTTLYRLSKK